MTLFTITLTSPISDDYSNRTLPSIRELRCSMHRLRSLTSDIIVAAPAFKNNRFDTKSNTAIWWNWRFVFLVRARAIIKKIN